MSAASAWGIVDEAQAAEVEELETLISPLACEVCQAHKGERVKVSEARPGKGGNCTPFHPHCMDSMVPVIDRGET